MGKSVSVFVNSFYISPSLYLFSIPFVWICVCEYLFTENVIHFLVSIHTLEFILQYFMHDLYCIHNKLILIKSLVKRSFDTFIKINLLSSNTYAHIHRHIDTFCGKCVFDIISFKFIYFFCFFFHFVIAEV